MPKPVSLSVEATGLVTFLFYSVLKHITIFTSLSNTRTASQKYTLHLTCVDFVPRILVYYSYLLPNASLSLFAGGGLGRIDRLLLCIFALIFFSGQLNQDERSQAPRPHTQFAACSVRIRIIGRCESWATIDHTCAQRSTSWHFTEKC